MKITHLVNTNILGYKCYCGKQLSLTIFPKNWTFDVRKTNCKGAMRVIKAAWDIFLNHEARRKK